MGVPYRVTIKVLARARAARRAIRHAGILAQDGRSHRRQQRQGWHRHVLANCRMMV